MARCPDVPEALDDTSWIAVKGGTVEAIVKVLDLSDPKPATWTQGMEVVGGNHDDCPAIGASGRRVYHTAGPRLAVGRRALRRGGTACPIGG